MSFNCITMYVCTEVPLINTQIVLQIFKQNMCTVYLCMHAFVCGYIHTYVCIHMYAHICICIMYVCMFNWMGKPCYSIVTYVWLKELGKECRIILYCFITLTGVQSWISSSSHCISIWCATVTGCHWQWQGHHQNISFNQICV